MITWLKGGVVGALTVLLVKTGVVGVVIAAVAGTAAVPFMFVYSRKSAVCHKDVQS